MEFYLCLVEFKDDPRAKPLRVLTTAIASSQQEAKAIAVHHAMVKLAPQNTGLVEVDVDVSPVSRETLEEAARIVLGQSQ